jgi:hypothetical protein
MARRVRGMSEGGVEPCNVNVARKDAANPLEALLGPAVAFCNSDLSSKRSVMCAYELALSCIAATGRSRSILFFIVSSYADASSSCTLAKIFAFHLV